MSRISDAFKNGKAFIPFITLGDPDLDTTEKIIIEMAKNGADIIELGIPFSDPTAEGPVIQEANLRALKGGINTDKVFEFTKKIRSLVNVSLVYMTYANVIFSYGSEKFISKCKEVGIDAIIVPDVPFEEREEFLPYCEKYGIDFIYLIAPTSNERIKMIAKEAKGFIYVVSSLGVTGVRSSITTDISSIVKSIKEETDVPCAIGFGIQTPDQAKEMSKSSDGVIVGSKIIKLLHENEAEAPSVIGKYVKEMKEAMN
ncbi:MAG: tryptophan synthase subunit alpha [Lachnospiraceae bacterium]|nr:tryptophan synthase subunit alpha [Lachnospiraceae bacterium]